jgi:hypothetical protein
VTDSDTLLCFGTSTASRPAMVQGLPLPPFDASDAGGTVHTVPPPELLIPPAADPLFMRADFAGVNLDPSRWGGNPPMLAGANSTPLTMLLTPMLSLYPRHWQDACLTEHAERGYSHFIISNWNDQANGVTTTPAMMVAWALYVKSWGFLVVYWPGQPLVTDPTLDALVSAHAVDWIIPGEEVDGKVTAEQYMNVLNSTLLVVASGIPVGAHFTSNYPSGFPRDTFLTDWSPYDGRVHLCWQADQTESAGTQGARLYYARQRVNLGLVGGAGNLALNSRVIAFETMATAQLYGQCSEVGGNLRSLELLFTTRNDARIPAVSGFGNGGRWSSGWPLYPQWAP